MAKRKKKKKMVNLDNYTHLSLFRNCKTSIINNELYQLHDKPNFKSAFSMASKLACFILGLNYFSSSWLSKT